MVANTDADYLLQFFVVVPPFQLVPKKPPYVIHYPAYQIGFFLHLQLNVDNTTGLGGQLEIHNSFLVLFEEPFEGGIFDIKLVVVVFGDIQQGFEKRPGGTEIFLAAKDLGESKIF
jgi:hypothetical protein